VCSQLAEAGEMAAIITVRQLPTKESLGTGASQGGRKGGAGGGGYPQLEIPDGFHLTGPVTQMP